MDISSHIKEQLKEKEKYLLKKVYKYINTDYDYINEVEEIKEKYTPYHFEIKGVTDYYPSNTMNYNTVNIGRYYHTTAVDLKSLREKFNFTEDMTFEEFKNILKEAQNG